MNISSINKKLKKTFGGKFSASKENGSIFVRGKSSDWGEIVAACQAAAKKFSTTHIVNDIVYTGEQPAPTRLPSLKDDFLDGRTPDVLVIGGGISGASIARELTKWKLDVLLVDKEADLALQASGRQRRRGAPRNRPRQRLTQTQVHSPRKPYVCRRLPRA